MSERPLCLYHKDCIDGTMAAAVVLRKFPDARTFPISHSHTQEDLEEIFANTTPDTPVYLVDIVCGLEYALERGYTVIAIDHHVSEHERVAALAQAESRLTYIFDNEKSGASLAWSYFFPDDALPRIIAHVEDKDLWRNLLGAQTECATSYLSLLRNNPEEMGTCIDTSLETIYAQGAILERSVRAEIAHLITIPPNTLTISAYQIPAFNITNHQSMSGNLLSETHGCAVAMYTIKGDRVTISFRSHDTHEPSALTLATILGGGGHRNASGASMSLSSFINHLTHT